jgi:hypothetical protein
MSLQNGTHYKTVRYKTVRLQNGNCHKTVHVTKRYLNKGISRENLEAAGTPVKEVVSRNYQHCFLLIIRPKLKILQ